MFIEYDFNEYGTMVSRHRCDACGDVFTLCPAAKTEAAKADTCGRPPGLEGPTDPGCGAYDEGRDVSKALWGGYETGGTMAELNGTKARRERGQS